MQRLLQTWHADSPSLVMDRIGCQFLIDAFAGGYHYQEKKEEPEKDGLYDHIVDAMGYIAASMFSARNAEIMRNDSKPKKLGNFRGM